MSLFHLPTAGERLRLSLAMAQTFPDVSSRHAWRGLLSNEVEENPSCLDLLFKVLWQKR